ncbi:MAG TPA: GNAT family N-acetyltransferase [Lentzea sp.]
MGVEEFDFAHASEHERRALYEVLAASEAEELREAAPYEACVTGWQSPNDLGFAPPRFAVAREGGQIVGYVSARVNGEKANDHIALVYLVVLPGLRRRGIGTALLRAMPSLMPGRTVAESWNVRGGTSGEHFAAAHGLRVVTSMTRQRLDVTGPPEMGEVPAGYELVTWTGRTPDEFAKACVDGFNAMSDAPFGDTALDSAGYTVDRLRREESNVLTAGGDRWVVLALRDGEIAGLTVVERAPGETATAEQLHTVVVPAHRGRGLGRLLKTRMLHELSGIEVIFTRTSSENEHMLRVNHALGYQDLYTYLAVQAKIADPQP